MARRASPLFLERGSYRRRRMMDALRLLVLSGVVLWMIPIAWPTGNDIEGAPVPMSRALFYIFGVWFVLILCAAFLSRRLKERPLAPDRGGKKA
ncbi:MAG: hypothetical protein AAGF27_09850 [Pseudomonadota bacterium]